MEFDCSFSGVKENFWEGIVKGKKRGIGGRAKEETLLILLHTNHKTTQKKMGGSGQFFSTSRDQKSIEVVTDEK